MPRELNVFMIIHIVSSFLAFSFFLALVDKVGGIKVFVCWRLISTISLSGFDLICCGFPWHACSASLSYAVFSLHASLAPCMNDVYVFSHAFF